MKVKVYICWNNNPADRTFWADDAPIADVNYDIYEVELPDGFYVEAVGAGTVVLKDGETYGQSFRDTFSGKDVKLNAEPKSMCWVGENGIEYYSVTAKKLNDTAGYCAQYL